MTEVKGVRRRIHILSDLRNRRIYCKLKRKLKIEKYGNDSLSMDHQEEIQVIFHNSKDLPISTILDNNNWQNRILFTSKFMLFFSTSTFVLFASL
jgi:hypothetical protein